MSSQVIPKIKDWMEKNPNKVVTKDLIRQFLDEKEEIKSIKKNKKTIKTIKREREALSNFFDFQ